MKKRYKFFFVTAILIIVLAAIIVAVGIYRKTHRISEMISMDNVEQIVVYDCFETYNPGERVAYELSDFEYVKAFSILDKFCGRELFGPAIIGETIFIMDVSYKDGTGISISVGEQMLGLVEHTKDGGVTRKKIRHFAIKYLNKNLLGQLFHANNIIGGVN